MAQKLKLHSPIGSDPLILKWPIPTSEGKDGPEEVLDTIKLVCEDYPELKVPLETRILKDGEDVSSYDYEQTRAMCDRYNKAIDSLRQLVKGHTRQKLVNKQASMKQLKHILQQCYNHSVKDPEKLNHYEPFSPEVYGETSFELVEQMIKSVKFSEHDYFIDLGSGVGQVVLQVSAATNCKFCYGVEKAEWPAEYAVGMEKEFRKWMKWYGKDHGEFKIDKGDFLHDGIKDKLRKATIVFVNNFAFGPVVDHELKQRFETCLKEGARIVSSKAFCPLNFRITARNLSDIGTIMQVEELSPLCGAVSWTGKPFAYYVHTIDRTLLEKYFQRLRHPSKKDEVEPRKDRKGRPLLSIKDKINGALCAGPDGKSGRWRRVKGLQRDVETASPLTAAKVLDFDSRSNSSFTNSGDAATVDENSIVYGPTTRRQWNEYVKRPQSQSGTENENDSSTADTALDIKTKDQAKQIVQKKKRMKTVKRLNNGALGKRQLQVGKKNKKEPLAPVKSKAAVKLRPRLRKPSGLSGLKRVPAPTYSSSSSSSSSSTASTVSTTTSTSSSNTVAHANSTVLPPSLDSLNLLHAHTVMSTSGKDPAERVNYNDRRMTESSSAYFKPTVQKQTVSMLEKEVGFLQMIETMKQRFLSFLAFMQTPEYRAMLLLQIEQEKRKNAMLKSQAESLERDISILQKDGVRLIKDRLREMGIKADTPRELISQAKDIMLRHHELKSQTASLGAQINALQVEHHHKITAYKKVLDRKNSIRHPENGLYEHTYVLDKDHVDQQRLLANINRLHIELQHLQNVNKPYVVRPETGSGPDVGLSSTNHEDKGVAAAPNGITNNPSVIPHMVKEKLDMKEKYDALTTVLAMVKKEVTAVLQNNSTPVAGIKLDPGLVSEARSDSVRQDSADKTLMAGADLKPNNPPWNVTDANANTTVCSNLQSFKTPESRAKEIPERATKITQLSVPTSWTSDVKTNGTITSTSPRILPPGTKIDIKKSPRLNGLNTTLKARVNHPNHYTLLQNSDNLISQSYKASPAGSYNSTHTFNLYTENEKSAAEDLISLSSPNVSVDHQTSLHKKEPISLFPLASAPSMDYVQNQATDSKSANRKHFSYDEKPAIYVQNRAHKGSSGNSLSKDSSLPCAISPANTTPQVFAQSPFANLSLSGSSSNQLTDQIKQILPTVSPKQTRNGPGSVKILAGPPRNGLVKHKSPNTSLAHYPVKVRTLEANDVQVAVAPSVAATCLPKVQQQPHILQAPLGQAPGANLSQVLKSEPGQYMSNQSFLNAHMSQTIVVSSGSSTSAGSSSLPFVTIQSPHVMSVNQQGSNGVQPSLLKIQQQQKPLVISSRSSTVCNGTGNSSSGDLIAVSPALSSQGTLAQGDYVQQTVKIMPPNGRDVKGCLHSPEPCSVVMSEFVPVAPSLPHKRGLSTHNLTEQDECQALPECSDSDNDDATMEVVQGSGSFRKVTSFTRKWVDSSLTRKAGKAKGKHLSKVSWLSLDLNGDSMENANQQSNPSPVVYSDLESVSDDEKQESLSNNKSSNNLSVLVKRESELEKMAQCLSDGSNVIANEEMVMTENETPSKPLTNGGKSSHRSIGSRQSHKSANKDKQLERVNDERTHSNTQSRKRKMSLKYDDKDSKKSTSLHSHPATGRSSPDKIKVETNNKTSFCNNTHQSVDFLSSQLISRKNKEHRSRLSQYQQEHSYKSQKKYSDISSSCEVMIDVGHCQNGRSSSGSKNVQDIALVMAEMSRELGNKNLKQVNSEIHNTPGKISQNSSSSCQHDKNLQRSEKVHSTVKSESNDKLSYLRFSTSNDDYYSDSRHNILLRSHRTSDTNRSCSPSESPTHQSGQEFLTQCTSLKEERSSELDKSSFHSKKNKCHISVESSKHSYSSKLKLSVSNKEKTKSCRQKSQERISSHASLPSPREKNSSAKSSRKYHSKNKDLSPGPPKLERAVSPSQNHAKSNSDTKHSSCFIPDSDGIDFNHCHQVFDKKMNNHRRQEKEKIHHSFHKSNMKTLEYYSNSRESSFSPKPSSRGSSDALRSSDLTRSKEKTRPQKKKSFIRGINKIKDPETPDSRSSVSSHETKNKTMKSGQSGKPERQRGTSKGDANLESRNVLVLYDGKLPGESGQSQDKSEKNKFTSSCVTTETKKRNLRPKDCEIYLPESSFPKNAKKTEKTGSETLAQVESDKADLSESPLFSSLDSPFGLLTPKSMSQTCLLEEEKSMDINGGETFKQNDMKITPVDRHVDQREFHFKEDCMKDVVDSHAETNLAHEAELFPFPPTPGKTPRSPSIPSSPATDINSQLTEEPNEGPSQEMKTTGTAMEDMSTRKGPQTPPGSPLFNHRNQSRSRSPSISSSSSRGSSRDSYHSSSSSSSFSDSSSDGTEKRQRCRQHRTPPRKLFNLITPVSLGISSPPKASIQYSPMPSPNITGFNYGVQIRHGLSSSTAPVFSNHGGTSVLSPLSISTQQSPGYQMVTSDSLRSPNGLVRSPVSTCLMRQHSLKSNTLPSPVSSAVSPSNGCVAWKEGDAGQSCKMINSAESVEDNKSIRTKPSEPDGKKVRAHSLESMSQSSCAMVLNTESSKNKSALTSKSESWYNFSSSDTIKDHNANNTSLRCSQSPHLQDFIMPVDCNQNVCQLPASCCSDSVHAKPASTDYSIKATSMAETSLLSCKLKPQCIVTVLDVNNDSETAASGSSQDSLANLVVDKSRGLPPCQPETIYPISSDKCVKASSLAIGVEDGQSTPDRLSGSSMLCAATQQQQQQKVMQYHTQAAASLPTSSICQSQQQTHFPQTKQQQQSFLLQHLHQRQPSFHLEQSPPAPPYLQLNVPRHTRLKNPQHSSHTGHYGPHHLHAYKDHHSSGGRRMGFTPRPALTHYPPHWGHGNSQIYNGPYYQNGPTHSNKSRHTSPPGPLLCFRDSSDHPNSGIMDYSLHGTMAQPYGSGQLDRSTPPFCMGSGSMGRTFHQHYSHFYHNKHH